MSNSPPAVSSPHPTDVEYQHNEADDDKNSEFGINGFDDADREEEKEHECYTRPGAPRQQPIRRPHTEALAQDIGLGASGSCGRW